MMSQIIQYTRGVRKNDQSGCYWAYTVITMSTNHAATDRQKNKKQSTCTCCF